MTLSGVTAIDVFRFMKRPGEYGSPKHVRRNCQGSVKARSTFHGARHERLKSASPHQAAGRLEERIRKKILVIGLHRCAFGQGAHRAENVRMYLAFGSHGIDLEDALGDDG